MSSTGSYSVEERLTILEEMKSAAVFDAAIKADRDSLPSEAQARVFETLVSSREATPAYWAQLLLNDNTEYTTNALFS